MTFREAISSCSVRDPGGMIVCDLPLPDLLAMWGHAMMVMAEALAGSPRGEIAVRETLRAARDPALPAAARGRSALGARLLHQALLALGPPRRPTWDMREEACS